jgi:hypothetical protein
MFALMHLGEVYDYGNVHKKGEPIDPASTAASP